MSSEQTHLGPADDLTVSLIQAPLQWQDAAANRLYFEQKIETIEACDLILLPEMFNSGFSMNSEQIAEPVNGPTERWLRALARRKNCAIAGSIATREADRISNRLLFASPEHCYYYDKKHLFRMADEHQHYHPGSERCIVLWRGWRLCLQICYDLRFPVFSRNRGDYDALIYVANWPAKRRYHWRQLLIARAIENQSCVLAVNRIGSDGNGLHYSGDSLILAADGEVLADATDREQLLTGTLQAAQLRDYRLNFPGHLDADEFELNP